MLNDGNDRQHRAEGYRANAEALRRIATSLRFDLCRQQQLRVLADGFERLAERVNRPRLKEAAD